MIRKQLSWFNETFLDPDIVKAGQDLRIRYVIATKMMMFDHKLSTDTYRHSRTAHKTRDYLQDICVFTCLKSTLNCHRLFVIYIYIHF